MGWTPLARSWRWVAGVIAVLLAAGAVLAWGPLGLGNGPLSAGSLDGGQLLGQASGSWVLMIPVSAGKSVAVIDGVALVGGDGYPAPRVVAILA